LVARERIKVAALNVGGSKYVNPTDIVQVTKIKRFMEMLLRLWGRSCSAIN
jgi:hypothetical protein